MIINIFCPVSSRGPCDNFSFYYFSIFSFFVSHFKYFVFSFTFSFLPLCSLNVCRNLWIIIGTFLRFIFIFHNKRFNLKKIFFQIFILLSSVQCHLWISVCRFYVHIFYPKLSSNFVKS